MSRFRFNRHELAGAFGDVGTDLPLLLAMIGTAGLDPGAVWTLFGAAQIATGLAHGVPMPMQPLKAMAVLVIAGRATSGMLLAAGLIIGVTMLTLSLTGTLGWLARQVPHVAVRGVQLGLAVSLARIALTNYVPASGAVGLLWAGGAIGLFVLFWRSQRIPPALPVAGLGLAVAGWLWLAQPEPAGTLGLWRPNVVVPTLQELSGGLAVLVLPQLALSLSNSVIATHKALQDLFAHRAISVGKIGITYGLINSTVPWLGGVPACHGCGGLVGHYAFGARTGTSVVLYGASFVLLGAFGGTAGARFVSFFPLPILGVMLAVEAFALARLCRDLLTRRRDLAIALWVALCAVALPQGYLVGLLVGTLLHRLWRSAPRAREVEQ